MKTNKINLHWQSVLLGMALCLVLVVFVGSKINTMQTSGQDGTINSVKVSDLQIKSLEMQREILAMNKDLSRIEKKIDGLVEEVHQVLKIVRVVERELEKGK